MTAAGTGRHISGVAVIAYAVALLAIGALGGWKLPLSWDEKTYYLPAVEFFAARLPRVPLDYPFPGPPTGLVVQALVYRLSGGSIVAMRVLSTLAAIATSLVLFRGLRGRRDSLGEATYFLMICAFPVVLYNAFTLNQHTLVVAFVVTALVLWGRGTPKSIPRCALVALLLTAAVTTNQLAISVCVVLGADALFQGRPTGAPKVASAAAAFLPMLSLIPFFVLWKGPVPPMHREFDAVRRVSLGAFNPAQLLLGLLIIGVWVAPAVGFPKSSRFWSALILVGAVLALPVSVLYLAPASFYNLIVGPISTSLRAIAAVSQPLAVAAGSLAAALGLLGVVRGARAWESGARVCVLAATFGIVMLFVPYLFESYYLIFVVSALVLLGEDIRRAWPSWPLVLHRLGMVGAGLAYTTVKLLRTQ
jgi:hypothetical protein